MASTDAIPVPRKNVAYRHYFCIRDADGDLVTGATGLDSEVSKDGGTFADCTNEATEIATSSGCYYLDLTNTEMNADSVMLIVKTTSSGAKTYVAAFYPEEAGDIRCDTVMVSGDSTAADNLESYCDGTTPMPVNATQISGDATAADNAESFFDGTGYAGTNNVIPTVTTVNGLAANTITATAIAADAIGASELAADAVSEIQSGLATSSALSTLSTRLTGLVMAQGTIGATGNDTTHLHLTGLPYGDDEINDCLLVIFDVSASEYHARWIEDWADTGDLATVATLPFTPQNSTDTYWLLPFRQDVTGGSGLDAAGVRAAVGLASANLDTQLGDIQSDTNDIQTRLPAALTGAGNIKADVLAISGDATAADNAEAFFDGTGYAGTNNVIPTVSSVTAVATGGITAGSIAADAIGASELATDAVTEIVNAIKAMVVETQGSYTLQQAMSIILAALAGVTDDNGATIKTPNGSATRIAATIDTDADERTAMTLTPSS